MFKMRYFVSSIAFIILALLLKSCIEAPNAINIPEWDVDLNLPITKKHYTLEEIVNTDETIQIVDKDGQRLFYVNSDTVSEKFSIREALTGLIDGVYEDIEIFIDGENGEVFVPIKNRPEVDTLIFESGMIELEVFNPSDEAPMPFVVTLPAMISSEGIPLSIEGSIEPGSTFTESIDLSGYMYTTSLYPENDKDKKDYIWITAEVGSGFVASKIIVNTIVTNSVCEFFSGRIPETDLEPISESISLPITDDIIDFRDNVELTDPVLEFFVDYISDFAPHFDINMTDIEIVGVREDGQMYLESSDGSTKHGDWLLTGGNFYKKFDKSNSNISDFITFMPDEVIITAAGSANPEEKKGVGTVFDSVRVATLLSAYSSLKIKPITLRDTIKMEIDEDYRKEIRNCKYAIIYYLIENALPFENDIKATFASNSYQPFFSKEFHFDGPTITESGIGNPYLVDTSVELSEEEIGQLSNSYYIILEASVQTPETPYDIVFTADQWVRFESKCGIKYHIDPEDK